MADECRGDAAEIVLRPEEMYWVGPTADDQAHDPCAHGLVRLSVGETVLAGPPASDGVNLAGAGLFLLRSLTADHPPAGEPTDHFLFPHCAAPVPTEEDELPVYLVGCPYGVNVDVTHDGASVVLRASGKEVTVSRDAWRLAVLGFCDAVEAFYARSPPRVPLDSDEDDWWELLWDEWRRRKLEAA
jgi:hypothetical protein